MKTQVKIYDDPEPTLDDIKTDKQLFLNANLTSKTLKEKFFLSKVPSLSARKPKV
jgi:hypothetical protein